MSKSGDRHKQRVKRRLALGTVKKLTAKQRRTRFRNFMARYDSLYILKAFKRWRWYSDAFKRSLS